MTINKQNIPWPKAFDKLEAAPGEQALWWGRPSWASNWVMILGIILSLVIPFRERSAEISPLFWFLLAGVFAAIAWSRRRQFYLLTNRRLVKANRFGPERLYQLALKNIKSVVPRQGLTGKLARCAHIFVNSWAPQEASLDLLGQGGPKDLIALIRATALAEGAELEYSPNRFDNL